MQKKLFQELIVQNRLTSSYSFNKITDANKAYRLNGKAASVGFIYRHIGELMNIFGHFFGVPTNIQNTTMGQVDIGQGLDIETSKLYIEKGYEMLENLVKDTKDEDWLMTIETPFLNSFQDEAFFTRSFPYLTPRGPDRFDFVKGANIPGGIELRS